jgi:hypothetical protein
VTLLAKSRGVYRRRAKLDGKVVGEKLEGDDGQDRLTKSRTFGTTTMSSAIPLSCFAQLPEVMAMTGPFRARTRSMLSRFFVKDYG